MKKALLLFTKRSVTSGEAEPERLMKVLQSSTDAQGLSMTYTHALFDDLVYTITPKGARILDTVNGTDIADYDIVYIRRWAGMPERAMAVAIYLKAKGVPYIDREAYGFGSKNKMTQAWRFWEAGLPHPATVYVEHGAGTDWLTSHISELPFGFPMVMKGVDATRGADNYLVDSLDRLQDVLTKHPDIKFILQEFIPNDGDYRVVVCGDAIQLVMHRVAASGKHTNNTSQGGQAALVDVSELSEPVRADCIRAAQIFGRDFAGVDLVYNKDTGAHLFFEVNRSPQIESGKYVPEKAAALARYLYEVSA